MILSTLLNNIRTIIKDKTGIVINDDRVLDLEIVLQSRFIRNSLEPDAYLPFLKNNYDELIVLASHFTIQETSFYRNKAHFDRLKFEILPALLKERREKNNKKILILSAGSATGEEPYTLSMLLTELIPDIEDWDITIIGTDINADVLEFARQGMYSKYKMRNIDLWYIQRFFIEIKEKKNTLYKLKDEIKDLVTFKQCNLIREPFELSELYNVDIILCENVIIYFNRTSIQRLIKNFYNILRDKGFLFLGYSETLNIYEHSFELSWWQESFAYQKDIEKVKEKRVKVTGPFCELPKKKTAISSELEDIDKKSYEEIIYLFLKNCDEKNVDNCINILKTLESDEINTDESFYIIKAEYLLERKKIIDAANSCRKSLGLNPHFIDAHILLGHIYIDLSMLESAEFELKTALYIDKSSILAWYYYALYSRKIGDEAKYLEFMKKAHSLYRNNNYRFKTKLYPVSEEIRLTISNTIVSIN